MTLGRHFALTEEDEYRLRSVPEVDRADWISNKIEEKYAEPWFCDTDKAWDAIHRAYDNSELKYDSMTVGSSIILGGEPLYYQDDYIISFKPKEYVKNISYYVNLVEEAEFRDLYFKIDKEKYGFAVNQKDFQYTWKWFLNLKPFYHNAAVHDRAVIFTAAQ